MTPEVATLKTLALTGPWSGVPVLKLVGLAECMSRKIMIFLFL